MSNDETQKSKRKWWRTRRAKTAAIFVACAAVIGFVVWLVEFYPYVSTDDARIKATMVRIAPDNASGRIIAINAVEGDHVKKDEILVELDHQMAKARVERASARFALATSGLKRTTELSLHRAVARKDLDQARAVDQTSQADLSLARAALSHTYLKSPIDGRVVRKSAEVGDILGPGQTALIVANLKDAWVEANIEETEIGDVRVGQPVDISVDAGGELHGHVLEILGATMAQFALIPAENPSGNYIKLVQRVPVKIALDPHPNLNLRAGESVEIKIRVH